MIEKKVIFVAFFLIFSVILSSGCFEEEYKEDKEKFVGFWKTDPYFADRSFTFFKNGTCYINDYDPPLVGNYSINETEKILAIHQHRGSETYVYSYRFDYTNDELTLKNQENYETYTYYRQ